MKKTLLIATALAAAAAPHIASASIVFDPSIIINASGQGFGNNPRLITVQNNGTESGCVTPTAGGAVNGGCLTTDANFAPNGVVNAGGNEASPFSDNQKFGVPTLGFLGWTSASDILLMFNATEPGGGAVNLTDVTLKFYNGTTLVASIDGQQDLSSTEVGNGSAGYAFVVDANQKTNYLQPLFANNTLNSTTRIAVEFTATGAQGGPESFTAIRSPTAPPVPEPATWAMMLIGFGAIGSAMRRRRSVGANRVRLNYA